VRVLQNPGNRGKGYSVRHGMLEAKGEWMLFTDADLSTPIEEIEKLFAAVKKNSAQVAIGSRALDRSLVGVHQPVFREYAGRFFNLVMRLVTGLPFHDTQCGFKLFQRERRAKYSRGSNWSGSGSTPRFFTSPSGWVIAPWKFRFAGTMWQALKSELCRA